MDPINTQVLGSAIARFLFIIKYCRYSQLPVADRQYRNVTALMMYSFLIMSVTAVILIIEFYYPRLLLHCSQQQYTVAAASIRE